jgi:hypothetical protein
MNDEGKCDKRPAASSFEIDEKRRLKNRILRFYLFNKPNKPKIDKLKRKLAPIFIGFYAKKD